MKQPREIIEDWREQNNVSQLDMAILLGLKSQQNYNDISQGRKKIIGLDVAIKFCDVSGINLITTFSREKNASSSARVPGPDASLEQLLRAKREFEIAAEAIGKRIDDLLSPGGGNVSGGTLSSPVDKGNGPKTGKSDRGRKGSA